MVDSLLGSKQGGKPPPGPGSRLVRSVLLGSVAVAFAVYWLARSYGVEWQELLGYLQASLAFVLFFALAGILAGLVIWLIGVFRRR